MDKHTKGPWRVGVSGPNGCPIIGTRNGLMVAMLAHSKNETDQVEEANANANLISAAPELLEALEPFAMYACEGVVRCSCPNCRARAVVAKAKGEVSNG